MFASRIPEAQMTGNKSVVNLKDCPHININRLRPSICLCPPIENAQEENSAWPFVMAMSFTSLGSRKLLAELVTSVLIASLHF